MYKKWLNLKKINGNYELEAETTSKTPCSSRINFTQLAFDRDDERLIVVDSAGYLYYIDLSNNCPLYQRLSNIGKSTFVVFNPINKSEILVGLTTGDIKILKVHTNVTQFCLLIAHKFPPTHVSFYKNYCLTCSRKEVIIWCLRSCSKAHQLRVNIKNVIVKKASFSSLGHVVVVYQNDTIQAWTFKQLESDIKVDAKTFGIRNIKDFIFTRNGRAMIIASTQNKIVILSTDTWNLLSSFTLRENFGGVKQLSVVPLPLDGGANNILACVSMNCTLHFIDVNLACFMETLKPIKTVKRIVVSSTGRYIAYIEIEGILKIIITDTLFSEKRKQTQKITEPCRPPTHRASDHLQCIRQSVKEELCLERLIPILKEFGEYHEKYRVIIWSTILKLPSNKSAYSALANKATCAELTTELLKNYPLADRNKRTLLVTTINCLIQWCPLLVQSSFLPNFVFPFLIVFQKDLLLAFELILSILLNYCQKWFEYHPLPPLNVLGIIENVLMEADPFLLNTFCESGITSTDYAWPLLKTAMSEVFSGSEWLILWDHLISFRNPSFFMLCVVAYSIFNREVLISLMQSAKNVKKFFTTQGHVRAKDLLKVAQHLNNDVRSSIHPNRYFRDELIVLPKHGPYPPFVHEFPKFLTEDLVISELRLKEKERLTDEYNRERQEIAEEKKLCNETKAFMNRIHRARLNEVRKCIKQQFYDTRGPILEPETITDASKQLHDIPLLDVSNQTMEDVTESIDKKLEIYEREVDKLEYEVQSFLNTLKPQRTGINEI